MVTPPGSCAAAAAKAAARMLLTGETVENIDLMTPKGILLHLEILVTLRERRKSPVPSERMEGMTGA